MLLEMLKQAGIVFIAGVPDSSLKSFCWEVCRDPEVTHVAAACEGGAVALAAGHWIATGRTAAVYMQNSGIANALNPLMSLVSGDAYDIPVILVIGWRGRPGFPDEPQHAGVGRDTVSLLKLAGIDPFICEAADSDGVMAYLQHRLRSKTKGALLVSPDPAVGTVGEAVSGGAPGRIPMLSRADVLTCVADAAASDKGLIVSGIGHTGRELMDLRQRRGEETFIDLPAVGGMGYAATLAIGIALGSPEKRVYCIDGDGAFIMHVGNQAVLGSRPGTAFTHIVLDNGCHQSVGGQPIVYPGVDYPRLARSIGYPVAESIGTRDDLVGLLEHLSRTGGTGFIHVPIATDSSAKSLPRPAKALQEGLAEFRRRHALGARA